MAAPDYISAGAVGIPLEVQMVDKDGNVIDISTATGVGQKIIRLRDPLGRVTDHQSSFTNTGTDGKHYYNSAEGDFPANLAGRWSIQGRVQTNAMTVFSVPVEFDVKKNL